MAFDLWRSFLEAIAAISAYSQINIGLIIAVIPSVVKDGVYITRCFDQDPSK